MEIPSDEDAKTPEDFNDLLFNELRDDAQPLIDNRAGSSRISKTELEHFKEVDLRLLDNKDYFRAVFD